MKFSVFYLLQNDYDYITQPILGIISLIRWCFHLESQSFEELDPKIGLPWINREVPRTAKAQKAEADM